MNREKRFNITDDRVTEYISNILLPYDDFISGIGKSSTKREHPTAEISTLRLLEIFVLLKKPKRILEIGTAEGRSSIILTKAMGINGKIDTIEIDYSKAEKAKRNFVIAGVNNQINLIVGDAEDVLENLDKAYDIIFIDAAKGQYVKYYELCAEKVKPGGLIFADNVLYRGMTAGGAPINRRQQLLVRRLKEYIENAVRDNRFVTDLLSIGDGVCISWKKENINEEN